MSRARSTAWKPTQMVCVYLGVPLHVVQNAKDLWSWWADDRSFLGDGDAPTLHAAQRAAERAVDAALAKGSGK